MAKVFNVEAVCKPEEHYMVNIDDRLVQIKELVDTGKYFTINRARQYGKTTTLAALERFLQKDYFVISMDFQKISTAKFKNEYSFSRTFIKNCLRALKRNQSLANETYEKIVQNTNAEIDSAQDHYELPELFDTLSDLCELAKKPVVLMIDEVDSAANNQVFLDFLAQLRLFYIDRDVQPTFQSVILAGVYDVKNLRRKIRPEDDHKYNSPWNIAADFNIDMSLSRNGIACMLQEYEADYGTGMNIDEMAALLYDYTSGYPFLVSRLCKFMDEEVWIREHFSSRSAAWTRAGFFEAERMLLMEHNTLFESLSEKMSSYPELADMLRSLLFTGKNIIYNFYEPATNIATMFGLVKNQNGSLVVANRIFDTWLYNLFLSESEMLNLDIYKSSVKDKSQFIVDGRLNMRQILEKFVVHFNDLYSDSKETFIEDEGRKYFLLYLRPIINGTGNYYIESQTRDLRRTDVIVDYRGERYVIEMKIWHGDEYNKRGEKQLIGYLDDYHVNVGYMVSFNFNKHKRIGVKQIAVGEKTIIEAVV